MYERKVSEAIDILSLSEQEKEKLPHLDPVYSIAIEALKKQLPIKPKKYNGYPGQCICGAVFLDKNTNYCGNCGQRLDWSLKDE